MKIIVTSFLLSSSLLFFGQNNIEKEKIINSYDKNKVASLKYEISLKEKERNERIANFILKNPNFVSPFYKDDRKYLMVDIIEDHPIYYVTDNALSAKASKTNQLYPGGDLGLSLEGQGMNVAIWDGGWVFRPHVEFMDSQTVPVTRITIGDGQVPDPVSDLHPTHVAGTIIAKGVAFSAKGMAPKANLKSYDWDNDLIEVSNEVSLNALLLSNHSYGVPILDDNGDMNAPNWYMGCYNTTAVNWDNLAYNLPYYLMVASAGNDGYTSYSGGLLPGYDKLTGNKNCKNNLVIANADPTVHPITGVMSSLVINGSSSQGPSDDGRIKPDIAADGTSLYSTSNAGTTSYATLTGTSMASPSVTGSLLLLQEHYNNLHSGFMRAATLKGLVCHTALDDAAQVGPDPRFGWGFLDTRESAVTITNAVSSTPTAILDELTLSQGDEYQIQVYVNDPKTLKATISWTDVPGTTMDGQLNSPTPALVNDLDLRIIKDTEINYPWKLQLSDVSAPAITGDNTVDNVEKVEVANASGFYTIKVSHKGTLVDGPQAYSLVVTGFDQVVLNSKSFTIENVAVYPNPLADVLNISSKDNAITKYQIFDMGGRLIKESSVNSLNNFQINTQDVLSGVYLLTLISENGEYSQKIVKN